MKMGVLKKTEDSLVELATAKGERIYLNLTQIQTVHVPYTKGLGIERRHF
ncbi:hypothetical protein ACIQZM_15380 [Peribacillus sp. NPDC097206]